MSLSYRTEKLGNTQVCVANANCADEIEYARDIARSRKAEESVLAFSLFNYDRLIEMVQKWKELLPRIHPFYATKCNYDPVILRTLALLGLGFDCASYDEVKMITDMNLIDPATRIIYASTIKMKPQIKLVNKLGVRMQTFDCVEELHKIADTIGTDAELVIRIDARNGSARTNFSVKFGAEPTLEAPHLLRVARDLGLNVRGISFHVGSGNPSLASYITAVADSRFLFDYAKTIGYDFKLLDVGGGFPGFDFGDETTFEQIANTLNGALDKHFPEGCGVEIIAEPGRYFASSVVTIAVCIAGVKKVDASRILETPIEQLAGQKQATPGYFYYLSDGLFQSLGSIAWHDYFMDPLPLITANDTKNAPHWVSKLWGPTLDSFDLVIPKMQLPKLELDDWLYFPNIGAYSLCYESCFNMMPWSQRYRIMGESTWQLIKEAEQRAVAANNNNHIK